MLELREKAEELSVVLAAISIWSELFCAVLFGMLTIATHGWGGCWSPQRWTTEDSRPVYLWITVVAGRCAATSKQLMLTETHVKL